MVDCAEKESVTNLPLSCSNVDDRSCTSSANVASCSQFAVVPYDETIIPDFHRLQRKFVFGNNHHVTIQQNWADGGVAAVVWDAAVVLAEYLVNRASTLLSSRQKVIELGAGTGLAGIVASQLGADVLLTDRSLALKTLNDNIELNRANVTGSIVAKELSWGEDLDRYPQPFDILLGADIIYIEETFDQLLTTIMHLSNAQTTILLSCRIRYERDKRFLDKLRQFFRVEEILYEVKRDVHIYSAIRNDD